MKNFPSNRPISINVGKEFITFYFTNESNKEFYSIPREEWVTDRKYRLDREDNWHTHMSYKTWFTPSMKTYIDENV